MKDTGQRLVAHSHPEATAQVTLHPSWARPHRSRCSTRCNWQRKQDDHGWHVLLATVGVLSAEHRWKRQCWQQVRHSYSEGRRRRSKAAAGQQRTERTRQPACSRDAAGIIRARSGERADSARVSPVPLIRNAWASSGLRVRKPFSALTSVGGEAHVDHCSLGGLRITSSL